MKKLFSLFLLPLLLMVTSLMAETGSPNSGISIIPKPVEMKVRQGQFLVDKETLILMAEDKFELRQVAKFFAFQMQLAGGPVVKISTLNQDNKHTKAVILSLSKNRSKIRHEGYQLEVSPKQVHILASDGAGLFYGIQSLLQLFPPEICRIKPVPDDRSWAIPCVEIKDHPRYPYRGMHLDVSRHFFPISFIKRYLDLIAMYKMNTFHWHLTDDNGWRIEIKKYPKLMETSAWRVDRENLPWNDRPPQKEGEKANYGGYYTQEEIREIVQYAADRFITVIPEIEMPAHTVEVLAAYPQFSCTGGPFTIPPGRYWPNTDIFCAGNDSVFRFLEDVLTEVMELFPSTYIHIGGDEADKTNWKKCMKCQERMKSEGLKNEDELQSYFIRRIEKFIVSKGRKIIGWDEILEGGLAPGATVMSWRGTEGGVAAARQGHDAIMTPGGYCYFDHYQADPRYEPKAIGGMTTLKKVYSFEPTPKELNQEEARHILGAQGNVWTEFIAQPSHVEYMAVPRMIALAEVVWSPRSLRNWSDFRSRLNQQLQRLDNMYVNYSKGSYKVDIGSRPNSKTHGITLTLSSEQGDTPIHYTLDEQEPSVNSPIYQEPIEITGNTIIKAALFDHGKSKEQANSLSILFHKAIGKTVIYKQSFSSRYPGNAALSLTDGMRGSTRHNDGYWQGFLGNDCELTIDMGEVVPIMSITPTFLQDPDKWIFLPSIVEFSLSQNGKTEYVYNDKLNTIPAKEQGPFIQPFGVNFPSGVTARYLTIKAKNIGKCPGWHQGAGEKAWLFIDEVTVY